MKKFKSYSLSNFRQIPQVREHLNEHQTKAIEIVANVLPFKVNNYVLDELIDWKNLENDPLFHLTFPQPDMLSQRHFQLAEKAVFHEPDSVKQKLLIRQIRLELNPHPAEQEKNIPVLDGIRLTGIQHKYRETMLFFPGHSQTCHAYCTFCFRWPQFVDIDSHKFASNEIALLIEYLRRNPSVTDLIFTGGDPMIMKSKVFDRYISALLDAKLDHLQTIWIGTKALTYWPYKFLEGEPDSSEILRVFEKVVKHGKSLSIMAHFNCPQELKTEVVRKAISRIQGTGAVIRSQAPIMKHVNDSAKCWIDLWNLQVRMGCVPYYMFIARDTGAQDYFAVTLDRAFSIYCEAIKSVSGLGKTARGPSMSASTGKINITGIETICDERVFVLQFLQARNPENVKRTFFAKFDPTAIWFDQLIPAFGHSKFFFQD